MHDGTEKSAGTILIHLQELSMCHIVFSMMWSESPPLNWLEIHLENRGSQFSPVELWSEAQEVCRSLTRTHGCGCGGGVTAPLHAVYTTSTRFFFAGKFARCLIRCSWGADEAANEPALRFMTDVMQYLCVLSLLREFDLFNLEVKLDISSL